MKMKFDQFAFEALQKINGFSDAFKKADPIKLTQKIASPTLRKRVLSTLMNFGVPFNRWLGLRIDEIGEEKVVIVSPPTRLRENHVGSTHACCLALIGEYAAGMCIANHYGIDENR